MRCQNFFLIQTVNIQKLAKSAKIEKNLKVGGKSTLMMQTNIGAKSRKTRQKFRETREKLTQNEAEQQRFRFTTYEFP